MIVASTAHIHYINNAILSSNVTFESTYPIICMQLELCYGIMASTIPCLKPFIAPFEKPATGPSHAQRSDGGYKFNSSGPGTHRTSITAGNQQYSHGRDDRPRHTANISLCELKRDHGSISSHDSRQMIIETTRGWSVEYEEASAKDARSVTEA